MTKPSKRRSAEEVKRLLEGFQRSGLTRREYCRREGIPVTTLDYYRQRKRTALAPVGLVRVAVAGSSIEDSRTGQFTLVLANGRRIESNWGFDEPGLTRLIHIVEAV